MAPYEIHSTADASCDELGADAGDAGFGAGLTALMPFLRRLAISMASTRELGEDLAQGALAKAWRSRRSFEAGSNLKAWLFTILRNEFYSHQRRDWRQAPWDPEWLETLPAVSEEQRWAVELSDTARAMKELPDSQREALILVGLGGFSYEDAAALSNAATGTMKSRVARGRQALKAILESQNVRSVKSAPANGNAMSEMLAQLSQLSHLDGARAGARAAQSGA